MLNKTNKRLIADCIYALSLICGILLMVYVYGEWSKYGDYTVYSFIVSVMIHVCPCVFIGHLIVKALKLLK